jgi:4-aminobutyrate aminotransferase
MSSLVTHDAAEGGTRNAPRRPRILVSPPGPRAADLVERDRQTLSSSFTRPYPLVIERGD